MSLLTLGHVILDGVTLPTDPKTYEPLNWEKRYSVHKGLAGAVTVQDFGTFVKDNTVHLASGGNFIDLITVRALHTKFRTRGATYVLTDWLGNSFTVFITTFKPVPTFIGDLWEYDMTLQVVGATLLLGEAI